MNNNFHILLLVCIVILSITTVFYFIKELQEILFLKRTLKNIINKEQVDSKEDIAKIKNFLNSNIKYDINKRNKQRPILRHTATHILKTNYGFCGENTRVAIKLLLLGGVKARRVYLFRKEWQHVLLEHEWKGKWFMFDGHYDPNTKLKDDLIASIPSEDLTKYPDNYPNNPYLNYCRIKLFNKFKFLKPFSMVKLPMVIIYSLESPYIVKGLFSMVILGIVCLLSFIQ